MPNLPEGTVQLNVPIPEELRDLLDMEVIERCGYPKRGILGEVVTEALREFLYRRHTHTRKMMSSDVQKKGEVPNHFPRNNRERYNLLQSEIKKYGEEHNYFISDSAVRSMIRQMFGNDKRTINKYLDMVVSDLSMFPQKDGTYSTPKPPPQQKPINNQ